jgi:uncharacterized protein (TIGR02246 family)
MKSQLPLWLATVLLVTAACQSTGDDESVKTVVRLFQEDFNEGSFRRAPDYTTTDWEHIHSGGGITRGRAEVLEEVRGVHQTILKDVSMTIDSIRARFVTSDVALVDAVHTVSPHRSSSGEMHINEKWIKTYVIVRRNGRWLLAHDHSTTIEGSMTEVPN